MDVQLEIKIIEAELQDVEKTIHAGYQVEFNENRRKFLQMQLSELKKDVYNTEVYRKEGSMNETDKLLKEIQEKIASISTKIGGKKFQDAVAEIEKQLRKARQELTLLSGGCNEQAKKA